MGRDKLPIYNLAFGKGEKLVDVARYIKNKYKSKSKIIIKKNHIGEVVRYTACIDKIKKFTGWKPTTDVYQTIDRIIKNENYYAKSI